MEFLVKNAMNREPEHSAAPAVGKAKIVVVGAGGAGNNSISRLMTMGGVHGAETVAVNTDMQHLEATKADTKILLGYKLTQGLGAGGYPEVGRKAAEDSRNEVREVMRGAHLVFLTCGLGGGTGTGAVSILADIAKKEGAIVIATVTTPFDLEKARLIKAEEGLSELRKVADTVIVIDNNKLVEQVPNLPLEQAFAVCDELIATMIKGISEIITVPSLVNLDFADIKSIMTGGGVAMIGIGESDTTNKVEEAVKSAMQHPLLDVDYNGGTGALIHIAGGPGMTLSEVTKAGNLISSELDPSAQVIWGARVDPELEGRIRVMTIVTGVTSPHILGRNSPSPTMEKNSSPGAEAPEMMKELRIDYT
jgi:cell division protein FtsZ